MTRMEKLLIAFLCIIVGAFVGEHILLVTDYTRCETPLQAPPSPPSSSLSSSSPIQKKSTVPTP